VTQLTNHSAASYLAVELEKLQQEAGNDACDADEEIDDDEEDVCCAGLGEDKRCRIHHWSD